VIRASVLIAALASVPTAAPDPAATQRARELRDEAFRRLMEDDFAGGISQLEEAYDLVPNPGLLLNIVIAYRRWPGQCERAYETFRRFDLACGSDCEFRREGDEQLAAVDAKCMASVSMLSSENPRVFIDGELVGRAPISVRLRPGRHYVQTSTTTVEGLALQIDPETPMSVWLPGRGDLAADRRRVALRSASDGLLGGAVVAGIVGAVFTGLAIDGAAQVDADGLSPAAREERAAQRDRDTAVAVISLGVATAAAALGLLLRGAAETDGEPPEGSTSDGANEARGKFGRARAAPNRGAFGTTGVGFRF